MGFLRDTYRTELARLEADLAAKKRTPPWKRDQTQVEMSSDLPHRLFMDAIEHQRAAQNIGFSPSGFGILHQTLGGLP